MKITGDSIIFNDGTTVYANNGIIGIGDGMVIYSGYDGVVHANLHKSMLSDGMIHLNLSRKNMLEIAFYMIDRWSDFKADIDSTTP